MQEKDSQPRKKWRTFGRMLLTVIREVFNFTKRNAVLIRMVLLTTAFMAFELGKLSFLSWALETLLGDLAIFGAMPAAPTLAGAFVLIDVGAVFLPLAYDDDRGVPILMLAWLIAMTEASIILVAALKEVPPLAGTTWPYSLAGYMWALNLALVSALGWGFKKLNDLYS